MVLKLPSDHVIDKEVTCMRYLLGLSLALVLVFAVSAVSLATPVVGAGGGQLVTFVDRDWETNNIGAGYGITDDITLGAVYDMTSDTYGAFANLTLIQFAVQAEVWFASSTLTTVTGLWNFDLDPLTLGLGGGLDHGPGYDDFFLSAAVSLAVGENFTLYGSVRYCPSGGVYIDPYCFKAGISLGF